MKKAILERNLVVILFVLVLVVFSLAERDSKKLQRIYNSSVHSIKPLKVQEIASTSDLK
jgi:hypothetical protein